MCLCKLQILCIIVVGNLVFCKIEPSECKLVDLISPSVHVLEFVLVAQVASEFEFECQLLHFLLCQFQLHSQQKQVLTSSVPIYLQYVNN